MKNLKIATWDMKEFELGQFTCHKEFKAISLLNFLAKGDVDVVALQNVDRKIAMRVNDKLMEFPDMGYHFDRLKSKDDYSIIDRIIDDERNPLIIKNNFINNSDIVDEHGLFINKVYLADQNRLEDKFCIVNTTLGDYGVDYNLELFSKIVNKDDYETIKGKTPIIITGRIDYALCSDEMLKLRKDAFEPNNIRTVGCINKGNRYNYIMANDFDVYDCSSNDDYYVSEMCKPLVANLKMK